MAAIAAHGADVLYILTGTRNTPPNATVTADVTAELKRYGDAWEVLELALQKSGRTMSPAKKRETVEALYLASRQSGQTSSELAERLAKLAA